MKMMTCPLNGPRNISEFVFGGDVHDKLPLDGDDATWAKHVFYPDNSARLVREWWLHAASGYWFIAERHRSSDEILRTFDAAELFRQRVNFDAAAIADQQSDSQ